MKKQTNTQTEKSTATEPTGVVASSMTQDLKSSVLIVSVIANFYIFSAWIALQVTTQFDGQLASFLFTR